MNTSISSRILGLICSLLMLALSTSAHAQAGNSYNQAQVIGSVQEAVVLQARTVSVESQNYDERMVGTGIGGVVGGLVGYAISRKGGNGSYMGSLVGTAAGGLVGNMVGKSMAKGEARELLLRTSNGQVLAVVQPLPAEEVFPGQRVAVLQQNGQTRVIALTGTLVPQ